MLEIDHIVLTVADVERARRFYSELLGLVPRRLGDGRLALHCDGQKLNLHPAGSGIALVARAPAPGSADLCLRTHEPVEQVAERLRAAGVELVAGPSERVGARARLRSIYCRDPDGDLVEIANELHPGGEAHAVHVDDVPAETLFAGVRVRRLWAGERARRALVVDIAPGASWAEPDVHLPGPEVVYVAEGDFEDEGGVHPAGTFLHYPAGSSHVPRSTSGCRLFVFYPEG